MSACSSAPQRQHTKHQWCHQQPRRELRHEHCSHCTVKNSIHSLVAMEALKATSTVAEDDPDLISKIRNRTAQPVEPIANFVHGQSGP